MPTYDYKCPKCGDEASVVQSMGEYSRNPQRPTCCGQTMDRLLSVVPAMSGLANAMAGDRHYDGLRAPDGTDISSRTKHRNYMKSRGLTTVDDFSGTWKSAEKERTAIRQGTFQDKSLRQELTKQVLTSVAKTE